MTRFAFLFAVTASGTNGPLARSLAAQGSAPAPAPYGSTLTFGTGLVSIPVAWVSPGSGDLFVSASARAIGAGSYQPKASGSLWDLTESLEAHIGGRFAIGAALYGAEHQQVGAFGQVLLLEQPESGPRWLPSLAFGVRNVGSSKYQDRFVTGDRRLVDVLPDSGRATNRGVFNASPTVYGVATREFQFAQNSASITVGYGNGLFKETGGLDTVNSKSGTIAPGLFLGARLAVPQGDNGLFSFMVENNGFDWNAGANFTLGHLSVGLYLTELEEGKGGVPDNHALANYTKTALSFSYNASLPGIIDGSTQRADAAEAQLELRRLEQEIAQRRARTRYLVAELTRVAVATDAGAKSEQETLLKQLDAERAALKSASKRLDDLQKKPPEGK